MKQWYAFYTKPNSENLVSQSLVDIGLTVFLPKLKIKTGKNTFRSEPFFPCYLFAQLDLAINPLSRLRWLPGVRNMVSTQDEPLAVPGEVIDGLQRKINEINAAAVRPIAPFKPGDQVRIVSGPFENVLAVFDRPLPSVERVQILMEILGQVRRVKISPANLQLEKRAEVHYNDSRRPRRSRGKGRNIKTSK